MSSRILWHIIIMNVIMNHYKMLPPQMCTMEGKNKYSQNERSLNNSP